MNELFLQNKLIISIFYFLFNSKWFQNPTKDTGINNPFIAPLKLEEIFFKIK